MQTHKHTHTYRDLLFTVTISSNPEVEDISWVFLVSQSFVAMPRTYNPILIDAPHQ